MKKQLLLFTLLLCALAAEAQTGKEQLCKVREQNSQRKPIANVQVIFEDAPAAISQSDGAVRLLFQKLKAGEWTFKVDIKRTGYELVNEKEVEKVKLSADNQFGVDIILARVGVLDSIKAVYYGVSNRSLKAGFEREKTKLRQDRDAARLSADKYAEQLEQLNKTFEEQRKNLDELAEKFARVNFDDVDAVYREALELYKAGEVKAAIAKLEAIDPAKRTEKIIAEQKRLEQREAELKVDRAALEKEKRQQITYLRTLADMYSTTFDPAKAESQYDQLLRLDSTDLEILKDAADFYRNNHRYDKALRTYPLIIAHTKAEDWQKANAYGSMGELQTAIGNLPAALSAYTTSYERYEKLCQREPKNSFHKQNLAIAYCKLGETHTDLGNFPKALTFFETYNALEKELYGVNPQNVDFKKGLVISSSKLGLTHSALGNLPKALTFLEESSRLGKELHEAFPQNVDFKNLLAIAYSKLGSTYTALGNLPQALTFFEKDFELQKELHAAYPENVSFKNNLAISYEKLGMTHTALGNLPQALTFFEQFNDLEKELHKAYPQNVYFKYGLAFSYQFLGDTHTALGNLPQALTFFEERSRLGKELHEAFPQNMEFKNGLAISCLQLGQFYKNGLISKDKAKIYFQKGYELYVELVRDFPDRQEFKINYQWVENAIVELEQASDPVYQLNQRIQNEPDTLAQYQLYTELCDTLRRLAAKDPAQKPALADALNGRVWTGFFLKKFAAAEADVREGLALVAEHKYLPSNLAPALLLQGKQKEALLEYQKWKDKPFEEQNYPTYRDVFLDDLNTFEKAGIIPPKIRPGLQEVRKLLGK